MNLFNYLMAKKGHNTSVRDDLFAYLLSKKTPKEVKTATGTTISISDVTREKIESLILSKESTQDGTPTPDNPIEVKTVKGYRNLFDKDDTAKILSAYITGNKIISYATNTTIYIPVEMGKTYTVTKKYGSTSLARATSNVLPNIGTSISNSQQISGNKFTYTIPNDANYLVVFVQGTADLDDGFTKEEILSGIQIIEGTEELPYVPYGNNYVAITNTNGTDTNYYTIPLNGNEIAGIGDYKDELIADKNGKCWLNKKTAKIDSYNGETITTNYMSTTGGLDTGATVYYVLETPQLIDLNYDVDITLFKGVNNITNSDDMDMTLKYY